MLITKIISDSGPNIQCEIRALKGVAASTLFTFSTINDQTGVETNDDLSGLRIKLVIRTRAGVIAFTFDSDDGTVLTTDAADGAVEPIWTATLANTLAVGVYTFRFEIHDGADLVDVPFFGNWYQES